MIAFGSSLKEDAVALEAVLRTRGSLEDYLNLALLYWESTDPGQIAASDFDSEYVAFSHRRSAELLDEAIERFPHRIEPRFWQRYIGWAALGGSFAVDEAKAMLASDPTVLLPAMYIAMATEKREGLAEARALLEQYKAIDEPRAFYVVSVLESLLRDD